MYLAQKEKRLVVAAYILSNLILISTRRLYFYYLIFLVFTFLFFFWDFNIYFFFFLIHLRLASTTREKKKRDPILLIQSNHVLSISKSHLHIYSQQSPNAMDSSKDRMEDLASLFLPDIMNPSNVTSPQSGASRILKNEEYDMNSNFSTSKSDLNSNTNNDNNSSNSSQPSSFQDFLNNNNFINRQPDLDQSVHQQSQVQQSQLQQFPHTSHYSSFNTYDPGLSQHLFNYNPNLQLVYQQQGLSSQQQSNAFQRSNSYLNKFPTDYDEWLASAGNSVANLNSLYQQQQQQHQQQQQQQQFFQLQILQLQQIQPLHPIKSQTPELQSSVDPRSGSSTPKRKKAKGRKRDMKNLEVEIDYKTTKLKRLLDFKQSGSTSSNDYKIIDKNNNEICIDFNGFLNGRFLTNDIDNNNYIFTKNELQRNEDDPPRVTNKKEDPQVVSCYRRNYIQISINMNIHGFKDDSKLLKLQTSVYGYTTTRVIKYFKIEVLAATNISNNKNVPIIIKNDPKDLEKEKEKEAKKQQFHASYEHKDDLVQPTFINTHEHVIILNNETIENGGIDKYFVVKKLQFKNATPNNGNLTFQNYYHLKAKLSCIVADIYYDDYDIDVDTEGNNNNEILLAELVSEPIIVRGRNPSFYAERNDILIKGRSATSKRAFRIAAQASLDRKLHVDDDDGSGSAGGQEYVHGGDDYMDHEDQDDGGDDDGNSTNINQMNNSGDDEDDGGATGSTGGGVGNSGYEGSNSGQGMPLQSNENMDENSPISTANGEERYSSEAPPLSYSTNQLAMDVKSVDKYKYYPINNVYYLPPINVVYFPHRAHHQSQREDQDQPPIISDSRKSSNVYFK